MWSIIAGWLILLVAKLLREKIAHIICLSSRGMIAIEETLRRAPITIMRISRLKPELLSVLAVLGLAACANGMTVSRVDIAYSYLPTELYVVATGKNELRTIIVGNPFDMPKTEFERTVLESLRGQNFGPPLNLSTEPEQEDARKRQVVIAFNLTHIKQVDTLCTGSAETAKLADTGARLAVTGTYCDGGGHYLTQATVRSDAVAGTGSEQFRRMMTQLAIALFPPENPRRCEWVRHIRICN